MFKIGVRQQQDRLLTAVSGHDVHRPRLLPQQGPERHQHLVPGVVAVAVIDVLIAVGRVRPVDEGKAYVIQ